jgi:hypothetical protein
VLHGGLEYAHKLFDKNSISELSYNQQRRGLLVRIEDFHQLFDKRLKPKVLLNTFNKTLAMAAAGQYLKYTRETYRRHLKQNDRYERPLMIPEREWKALIEDAKEKKLTDEGKTPSGPRR